MHNVIHCLFISCIHVMLVGSLWCLLGHVFHSTLSVFAKLSIISFLWLTLTLFSGNVLITKRKISSSEELCNPRRFGLACRKGRRFWRALWPWIVRNSPWKVLNYIIHSFVLSLYFLVCLFKFLIIHTEWHHGLHETPNNLMRKSSVFILLFTMRSWEMFLRLLHSLFLEDLENVKL